ncbi:SecDF P1 head subdomain-containing protein [Aquicella lusitana]|uniref:SecDF P1 head subdomain domain-containing protein n=1 Tax=Aquicella lusitana TaxID=254246 RepID=A0A370GRM0_9COXI|nr:hypothetical protein [Aquicella lusitana]RDI46049.1 hypothetical protein C8D86_10653 [Aquicella lusitana]VVC73354.1 hypothetical protein AQULUS_10930 [Aquicella lusitana]
MRIFSLLFICTTLLFSTPALSLPHDNTQGFLMFQVIQDQIIFDNSNIKSAMLIEREGNFIGLEIELKAPAIDEISRISKAGLGKQLNIVLDKKIITTAIIQTPLGGKLLIKGITRQEAQEFLDSLNHHKQPLAKRENLQEDPLDELL